MNTGLIFLRPKCLVTVAGIPTSVYAWETQHGVDQLIGTASVTLPLPLPPQVTLNARVEIQAGYADTGTERVFSGRIVDIDRSFDASGKSARVKCNDWMELLDYTDERDLVFPGTTLLADIFRSLAQRRRVPMYTTDHVYYADGAYQVAFGGNRFVDGGDNIIRKRTSPLQWLSQKARLVGYRVYCAPNGQARLTRVSGKPALGKAWGTEGVDVLSMGRSERLDGMFNAVIVTGASYTDSDGVPIKITSFAQGVPPDPLLTPPGYRPYLLNDGAIVSQTRADAIRQVWEIDLGAPKDVVTWEIAGAPSLQPGDAVRVTAPTLALPPSDRWIMSVRHSWSDGGFWTALTGWAGAGRALPSGNDAKTISIGTGPYHLGDERVPWYAVPNPGGTTITIPFTFPDEYTAIILTGLGHGVNSQYIDGAPSDELKVSKVEVWQGGESVGTVDLPAMPEHYERKLDYRDLVNWIRFRRSIGGKGKAGAAELRIVAGGTDDFELRDLQLILTGVGQPTLPELR